MIIAVITSLASCRQESNPEALEQTSFCDGGAPDNTQVKPIALPPAVLTKVMNTNQGSEAKALANTAGVQINLAEALKGQQIHPADSGGPFFVVMGSRSMSGGDHAWFWIVRHDQVNDEEKTRILLFAGGNCLNLDTNKTRGYRDVLMTWSSPSETITNTYAYNGKEYKIKKTISRPNR